jgi:hypothetical protein
MWNHQPALFWNYNMINQSHQSNSSLEIFNLWHGWSFYLLKTEHFVFQILDRFYLKFSTIWSMRAYSGTLVNAQLIWIQAANRALNDNFNRNQYWGGRKTYLDKASCKKFPSMLTRSTSSLKMGASSHACLQKGSGRCAGSRENGAWTKPTPGTVADLCGGSIKMLFFRDLDPG